MGSTHPAGWEQPSRKGRRDLFVLIHHADAGAFTLSVADALRPESPWIHCSFTTLTTVGYGAIAQLYQAAVLARLVSLQITHAGRERTDR